MTDPFAARRPGYDKERESIRTKRALLSGSYLPRLFTSGGTSAGATATTGLTEDTRALIPMRPAGESDEAYLHKVRTLDPDGLFAYVTGSLAGQVTAAASEISRTWTQEDNPGPFGKPDVPGTEAYRLTRDADGAGTNWEVLWDAKAPADLVTYGAFYVFVDGTVDYEVPVTTAEDGALVTEKLTRAPSVRVMPADAVVNEVMVGDVCVARRLMESREESRELGADPVTVEVYTDYRLDGWERWERVDGGEPERVASGTYAYFADDDDGAPRRVLPNFRVDLGLERDPAYVWARRCIARLYLRAGHDSYLGVATAPRLHVNDPSRQPGDDGQVLGAIRAGGNVIETSHEGASVGYVEPAMNAASLAADAAEAKRKEVLREAYLQADDAARQATATEVHAQQNEGGGAFLSLVSIRLDEGEARAAHLLAQALAPDDREGWRAFTVKRSRDFVAFDEAERVGGLVEEAFGPQPVPMSTEARVKIRERHAKVHGLPFDQEKETAAVEAWERKQRLGAVPSSPFTGPIAGGDGQPGTAPELNLLDELREGADL